MSLIRDDEEAWLAELHGRGTELLERYRELRDDASIELSAELDRALADVIEARRARLGDLAERIRARDALPNAGDPDRAFAQVIGDLLGGAADALADRLVDAETRWAETLDRAREVDWDGEDRVVLDALARHIEASRQRFSDARDR